MTTALDAQQTEAYCAAARASVTDIFLRHLGPHRVGLSVFGSVAVDGPLWEGSDIDLIVTLAGSASTAHACTLVAAAAREAEEEIGLPVSITFGTVPEISRLWSETVRRALSDNAVTLHGPRLAAHLTPADRPWNWSEVRRGAVRLLCFTRRHIVDQYIDLARRHPADSGTGGDWSRAAKAILKNCVNATRFAVWSATPPGRPLVSRPEQVLERAPEVAGADRVAVVRAALDSVMTRAVPDPALLAASVDAVDHLLARCRRRSVDLFRAGDIFIDPV